MGGFFFFGFGTVNFTDFSNWYCAYCCTYQSNFESILKGASDNGFPMDVASGRCCITSGCAGSHDFPHIAGAKQTKYINLYSLLQDKQEQEKGL